MPYSYGQENLRQNPRVSVQPKEPGPLVPPHRVEWREPGPPVPPPHRVVRQRKSRSGRSNLQMIIGIGLIVFSLVVVFNMRLLSDQSLVLRLLPSTQMDQTNQLTSLPGLSFPVKKIIRKVTAFSQGDKTQYNNKDPEWSLWHYSACSGCAMAALMDAYSATLKGRPLNCGDVLEVEYRLSVYNPVNAWGLITGEPDELAATAAQFGFTGHYTQKLSLDDLIHLANAGIPYNCENSVSCHDSHGRG